MKWLERFKRRFTRIVPLGRRGERHAAAWLSKQGYRIVHSNISIRKDEADIVAIAPDGRTLVIVEVKTRQREHPAPELSINRAKRQHLTRLASQMLRRRQFHNRPVRFDVVAVIWPEGRQPIVRHHVAAFESGI